MKIVKTVENYINISWKTNSGREVIRTEEHIFAKK